MNILITNIAISANTGTELYVKELALELQDRGHQIEIYTIFLGNLSNELINKNINVVDSLSLLKNKPDIIHAHHNIVALKAAYFYNDTPIVFFIHDRTSPLDYPFLHENIIKYLAVDDNCKERYYLESHFLDEEIQVIFNWYNPDRFIQKKKINAVPKNALIFSNYINKGFIFNEIKIACLELGINLDIIGSRSGNSNDFPEGILSKYDIVFAKAKAGIEAITTGAALIVCDYKGLAGMVNEENVEHFRKYNFGMKLMTMPIKKELLILEINKYKVSEIEFVSNYIRAKSNMYEIITEIEMIYINAIKEFREKGKGKYKSSFLNLVHTIIKNYKIIILYYLRNHTFLYNLLRKVYLYYLRNHTYLYNLLRKIYK